MNSVYTLSHAMLWYGRAIWHTWWVHNWDNSTTPETVHPSRSHPFSCMPDQLQSTPVTLKVVRESHLLVEPADICRQKDTIKLFHVGIANRIWRYWCNLAKVHAEALVFFFVFFLFFFCMSWQILSYLATYVVSRVCCHCLPSRANWMEPLGARMFTNIPPCKKK